MYYSNRDCEKAAASSGFWGDRQKLELCQSKLMREIYRNAWCRAKRESLAKRAKDAKFAAQYLHYRSLPLSVREGPTQ